MCSVVVVIVAATTTSTTDAGADAGTDGGGLADETVQCETSESVGDSRHGRCANESWAAAAAEPMDTAQWGAN